MNLNKTFVAVQDASRNMLALSDKEINQILLAVADAAINKTDFILSENQKDLERMPSTDPKYDRLKLTKSRLQDIVADIRNVAALPSPLGKVLKENVLPNGLKIKRVSVPFGVIGIIYEARPNVSFDVFSLCLKSGNACILKGGSDADYSQWIIDEFPMKQQDEQIIQQRLDFDLYTYFSAALNIHQSIQILNCIPVNIWNWKKKLLCLYKFILNSYAKQIK